jgi:hypothetical protein
LAEETDLLDVDNWDDVPAPSPHHLQQQQHHVHHQPSLMNQQYNPGTAGYPAQQQQQQHPSSNVQPQQLFGVSYADQQMQQQQHQQQYAAALTTSSFQPSYGAAGAVAAYTSQIPGPPMTHQSYPPQQSFPRPDLSSQPHQLQYGQSSNQYFQQHQQ